MRINNDPIETAFRSAVARLFFLGGAFFYLGGCIIADIGTTDDHVMMGHYSVTLWCSLEMIVVLRYIVDREQQIANKKLDELHERKMNSLGVKP